MIFRQMVWFLYMMTLRMGSRLGERQNSHVILSLSNGQMRSARRTFWKLNGVHQEQGLLIR